MLWWNVFTVLDVLLLLIYNQLGPRAVFYVNNVIWFLGLDLYHLYFTIALWTSDIPSIKELPQEIVFYPLKPTKLEPRRPKLEHKETSNSNAAEDQNSNMVLFEELYSCNETCDFRNGSIDKKGKGGGRKAKRKVTGENKQRRTAGRETAGREQDNSAETKIFNRPLTSALPPVSD